MVHCSFHVLQGLRKRKINKFIPDKKYIAIHQSISNQSEKVLPQISGLRIWRPSRKFGQEMNLLKKFVEFSLIILKAEVNFFIREFLEVFYFPSDFIVVAENF